MIRLLVVSFITGIAIGFGWGLGKELGLKLFRR